MFEEFLHELVVFECEAARLDAEDPTARDDDDELVSGKVFDSLAGRLVNEAVFTFESLWCLVCFEFDTLKLKLDAIGMGGGGGGVIAVLV